MQIDNGKDQREEREGQREGQAPCGLIAVSAAQRRLRNHKIKRENAQGRIGLHCNEFGERELGSSGKVQDLGLDRRTGSAYIANTHTPGGTFDDDRSLCSD